MKEGSVARRKVSEEVVVGGSWPTLLVNKRRRARERAACPPGLTESTAKDEKGRPTLHTYLARRRTDVRRYFPPLPLCLIFVGKGESIPLNPGEKENAT